MPAYLHDMELESLAIFLSAISLLVAGLSLGWQILQWLLSAGRSRAVLYYGVLQGQSALASPVPKKGSSLNFDSLRSQGSDGPAVVGVEVTNHGRASITVQNVVLKTRGGTLSLVPVAERLGPDLPYRLEPGTNASWYLEVDHAVRLAKASREVFKESVTGVYMVAHLATGKSAKTRRTLGV